MGNCMHRHKIKGVKHIIVVASGKGGVGKSTVAANLAVTLARDGYRTALVDADIYGPSMPKMFGIENEKLMTAPEAGPDMMTPIEKYGIKINSIGLMVDNAQAIIWRGPLAANALDMLFKNTVWGDIDYMIVDFPPGTGDIQISTLQKYKVSAAIVVTTPQVIAVNDARKGADMFAADKMNVPLLGIVENMSWFTPAAHPEEKYYIFGQGGGQALADEFHTRLLAQIPLVQEVGTSSEKGCSIWEMQNSTGGEIVGGQFFELARVVTEEINGEEPDDECCDEGECCETECDHDCSNCKHKK